MYGQREWWSQQNPDPRELWELGRIAVEHPVGENRALLGPHSHIPCLIFLLTQQHIIKSLQREDFWLGFSLQHFQSLGCVQVGSELRVLSLPRLPEEFLRLGTCSGNSLFRAVFNSYCLTHPISCPRRGTECPCPRTRQIPCAGHSRDPKPTLESLGCVTSQPGPKGCVSLREEKLLDSLEGTCSFSRGRFPVDGVGSAVPAWDEIFFSSWAFVTHRIPSPFPENGFCWRKSRIFPKDYHRNVSKWPKVYLKWSNTLEFSRHSRVNLFFHGYSVEFSIRAIKLFCIPRWFMAFILTEGSGKKTERGGNSSGIWRTLGRCLQRAGVVQNSPNFLVKTGNPLL